MTDNGIREIQQSAELPWVRCVLPVYCERFRRVLGSSLPREIMRSNPIRRGVLVLFAALMVLGTLAAGSAVAAPFYVTNVGDNTVKYHDGVSITPFASVNQPVGIDRDAAGNVYVSSLGNNNVARFTPTGTPLPSLGSVPRPIGLRIGPDNNVHVSSASDLGGDGSVRRFTLAGTPLTSVAGNGGARGITFANGGHLFVADLVGNAVREYD